jgi:putative transposase
MGNLLGVHVHAANIHDTKGGCYVFAKALKKFPTIKGCCADQGYRGTFKRLMEQIFKIVVDISEKIKPQFEILPKRWRVERTFSWLTHSRRLSKDYEIKTSCSESMVRISHIHTLLRHF